MAKNNWGKKLLQHQYPPIVYRYPILIRLLFFWNRLTTLRVWHIRSAIRREMNKGPIKVWDVGMGEGQYLWWMSKNWNNRQYWGLDYHFPHIEFAHRLRKVSVTYNVGLMYSKLSWISDIQYADLIICIGVLQYIEDDRAAIHRLFHLLAPDGKMILYVPVNGRNIFPCYSKYIASLPNYELLQNRKRIYKPEEVIEKLNEVGFELVDIQYTYGKWGIMAYEWYNTLLYGVLYGGILQKVLSIVLLMVSMPIIWLMMWWDYGNTHQDGNGLCVVVQRPNPQSQMQL